MTTQGLMSDKAAAPSSRLGLGEKALRRLIGVGVRAFGVWRKLSYRAGHIGSLSLNHVDHVTIPCTDLAVAEEFYVGVLGAKVAMRIDRRLLLRLGWTSEEIDQNAAEHLSLTIGGGPRIDLFQHPKGESANASVMHPHIAFMVSPVALLAWKRHLNEHGVPTAGPTQPGPPGQASFYFNDPFGNHLELVTVGFTQSRVPVGVPDRSRLDYTWRDPASLPGEGKGLAARSSHGGGELVPRGFQ
jgi:catechol 2,3-dioxygenase-like lactoylglutathione lyase family enzyme